MPRYREKPTIRMEGKINTLPLKTLTTTIHHGGKRHAEEVKRS